MVRQSVGICGCGWGWVGEVDAGWLPAGGANEGGKYEPFKSCFCFLVKVFTRGGEGFPKATPVPPTAWIAPHHGVRAVPADASGDHLGGRCAADPGRGESIEHTARTEPSFRTIWVWHAKLPPSAGPRGPPQTATRALIRCSSKDGIHCTAVTLQKTVVQSIDRGEEAPLECGWWRWWFSPSRWLRRSFVSPSPPHTYKVPHHRCPSPTPSTPNPPHPSPSHHTAMMYRMRANREADIDGTHGSTDFSSSPPLRSGDA